MNTMELFCGTKSFSKAAKERGHETFTLDSDPKFSADVTADILEWDLPGAWMIDFLWASPPCTAFSVASIGHHWKGGFRAYEPRTEEARLGIRLVERTLEIIECVKPKWWFIENPRGVLRKLPVLGKFRRVTVTYCQYGDGRMKPTDLWTNVPESLWKPRPMCKNGDKCHESAPRGSKTGTQGLKGKAERGRIPAELFKEIFDSLET